jgi:RNA polymerase sigma factor (sigma-70 family)
MAALNDWNFDDYRHELRLRANWLMRDVRLQARFDQSDLVQDTLVKAVDPETPPCQGRSREERLAWLLAIQNHLAVDRLREHFAQRRDVRKDVREQQVAALRQHLDDSTAMWVSLFVAHNPTPSEQVAAQEEQWLLQQAVEQLPEREAAVMRLRLNEALSIAEIAERLRLTPGSVAGLIRRAEQRLTQRGNTVGRISNPSHTQEPSP